MMKTRNILIHIKLIDKNWNSSLLNRSFPSLTITIEIYYNSLNVSRLFLGQWSPLNPNGKKVYDMDFLYSLKDVEKSRIKPTNINNIPSDIIAQDDRTVS